MIYCYSTAVNLTPDCRALPLKYKSYLKLHLQRITFAIFRSLFCFVTLILSENKYFTICFMVDKKYDLDT